jgi:outer membrane protein OmpA-like peptidoglycan-associated protein
MRLLRSVIPATLALLAVAYAQANSLDAIQTTWPDAHLSVTLGEGGTHAVEVGNDLSLRIGCEAQAHVTIILATSDGEARLVRIARGDNGDTVAAGAELIYPEQQMGEHFYADAAPGKAVIYVIASYDPIFDSTASFTTDAHGWAKVDDLSAIIEHQAHADQAQRLALRRVPVEIVSPATVNSLTKEEFVEYYAIRTRGVTNAGRGLAIRFDENKASLDPWGKRQLDAVGQGLQDPRLGSYKFAIEGHTDDIGTEEYNDRLSVSRAQAVRDYLAAQYGIKPDRLSIKGFGKAQPAAQGTSTQARAENRRVVIRRLDSP